MHPDIEKTMRTGYPMDEPAVVSHCSCGAEIREGDNVIEYEDMYYCDALCLGTFLDEQGMAKPVIAK